MIHSCAQLYRCCVSAVAVVPNSVMCRHPCTTPAGARTLAAL
jgi:hypothetical protein